MLRILLPVITLVLLSTSGYSQIFGTPDPCTDGNQETCECETAPILCTINDLDGYEYDMDTFEHPDDGPEPMCPGSQGNNTASHNPTWFSFISWCEELTIEVTASDCVDGPACNGNNDFGIQVAVYEDCSLDPNSAVGCATDVGGCENDFTRELEITGMIPGETYYFLVDGCCSSACHVTIDVIDDCSIGDIPPWDQEILGPCVVCDDGASYDYYLDEPHPGAVNYFWYLDNSEINGSGIDALDVSTTFPGPGEYEICVDVDNKPCILETDPPEPLCKTITVLDNSADAGDLTATTSPACPEETIDFSTTGFTSDTGFEQWLVLTDDSGEIIYTVEDSSGSYTSDECISYTLYSYNFYIDSIGIVPVVGQNVNNFEECMGCFCDFTQIVLVWEDDEAPTFDAPPADATTDCLDDFGAVGEIAFTDNCLGSGMVQGTETGDATLCEGGELIRTWTVMDSCGNETTHTQIVTVNPIPLAAFIDVPADESLSCADQLSGDVDIDYTNNSTGTCLISGTITGTTDDTVDICGGDLTYTWEFTDQCDRLIMHTQVVTIDPPLPLEFIDVPPDVTITCDELPFTPVDLDYTNLDEGLCLREGFDISPTSVGMLDICGDQITYTWSITDDCDRTFDTMQIVTLEDTEEPVFTTTPDDITYDCFSEVLTAEDLEWTDNCDGSGLVSPTESGTIDDCLGGSITREWTYTDMCDLTVTHTQTITVDPRPDVEWTTTLPEDIDVICGETVPAAIELEYTNSAVDICLQEGSITAVETGALLICGDQIVYTWEFTPECGPMINHTQTITLIDTEFPEFIDPPIDETFDCFSQLPASSDLEWTDNCDGNGIVSPTETGSIDNCTGGELIRTWEYTDMCNNTTTHTQVITVNPRPDVLWTTDLPEDLTVNCGDVIDPAIPLDYSNMSVDDCLQEGTIDPVEEGTLVVCDDQIIRTWEFPPECGPVLTHTQTITLQDIEFPEFIDPPANEIINCYLDVLDGEDLMWTDNCDGTGMVSYTETGVIEDCDGGELIRTWTYTDMCDNTTTHEQIITVTPTPEAEYIDPPGDETVSCADTPSMAADLMYSNDEANNCLIEGTVTPTMSGSSDLCGGELIFTWEETDQCDRVITHSQTVTVEPTPEAAFIDPPADITVDCENVPATFEDLMYSNDELDDCLIEGMVSATESGTIDVCGGELMINWEFTDACGRTIQHEQIITVEPAPVADFTDFPADITINCNEILITPPSLDYTNNLTDDCQIEGSVEADQSGTPDECGGVIIYDWIFTDDCGRTINYSQTVTVEPAPQADFLEFPSDTNITCDQLPYNAPAITYTNNETGNCEISGSINPSETGDADECGGLLTFTWDFTDDCGRTIIHIQNITVDPAAPATFDNAPADITISCLEADDPIPSLSYTNNQSGVCEIEGTASPFVTGDYDLCGGEFTVFWEFVDACDRIIDHTQVITVEPTPEAVFINVPSDDIVDCADFDDSLPELIYDNGGDDECEIQGTVTAFQSGSYDECGGVIVYSWSFTDDCGRTITADQEISILAAPAAEFIDVPNDITVLCDDPDYVPEDLDYTNGLSGICEINGSDSPSEIINGNVITYLWSYTDPCSGITTEEEQEVTLAIEPDIEINPATVVICEGDEFDLNSITVTELNGSTISYTWHTDNPPTNSNEVDDNLVSPTDETIYYVFATNEFDCTDIDLFVIEVDEPVFAGNNGSGSVCSDESSVDIFTFLNNVTNFSGIWTVPAGSGINTSNPMSVDFSIVPPGTYELTYTILSGNSCPESSAIATVEVFEPLEISIVDIECSMDQDFYTVTFNTGGATISINTGTFNDLGNDMASISDIDINDALTINAVDPNTNCTDELIINPPNCDCPDIEPPIADNVDPICDFESPITLSVTVGADETANWYDMPSGGTLLASMTTTFEFTETTPGVYTYYVETQSTIFPDCVSLTLTEVVVEIADNPNAQDATISNCDDDYDGLVSFDLTEAESSIGGTNNYTYAYFETLAEAQSNTNALNNIYQNTTQNSQVIFVLVTNSFGCTSIVELTLEVLEIPFINPETSGEICLGDDNGFVVPNVNGGSGTIELSIDGVTYEVTDSFTNLSPGNYTLFAIDENQCVAQQDFTIDEGLSLLLDAFTFTCSDNGTDTDPTDDFYNVDFNISTNLGGVSYTVYLDNDPSGSFNYDSAQNIELPADGSTITIRFEDDDTGCFIEQVVGPLNPCSTNCTVDFTTLDFVCNGNGTASDPSDDFYDITINVIGANASSNNTYNVLINGTVTFNFTYQQDETFTLPADGTSPVIAIVDNEDNQCQNNMTIGPLNPCSDLCIMIANVSSILCDNQGTENDVLDDTYTIELIVGGANVGGGWSSSDGQYSGNYDEVIILGPFLITDGDVNIEIVDNDDNACMTFIEAIAPPPCSAPCEIEMVNLNVGACNDNNTGMIQTDDFYSVSFQVNVNEGSTNQYIVEIGMAQYGPFMYGQVVSIDNLPADGSMLTAVVTDITFGQCVTMFDFTSPVSCSSCDQTVEAGNPVQLDCTNTSTTLMGMASETATYEWNGPNFFFADTQDATVGAPGTYYVEAFFSDGCTAIDSVEITVDDDIPIANAGPDLFITCDTDSVTFTAIVGNLNNIEILWTDESGMLITNELSFSTDVIGTYNLQLVDTLNNCSSAVDQVILSENTNDPLAVIYADPGNQIDCIVASITLTNELQDNVVYNWTFNGNATDAIPLIITEPGLIELFALDTINGCTNSAVLDIVDIQDFPIAMINPTDTIDCVNDIVTLTAFDQQINDDIIYNWYDANNNPIAIETTMIEVMAGGLYYLEAIDTVNNCFNSDSAFVESLVELPDLEAGEDQILGCGETTTSINPVLSGNPSDFEISWTTTNGSITSNTDILNIDIEGEGLYIINVLNTVTSCEVTDSVLVITTEDLGSADLTVQDVNCHGENNGSVFIDVTGGVAPYTYSLQGGGFVLESSFDNLPPGDYTLDIMDANGCSLETSFVITEPEEISINLIADVEITIGDEVQLLAEVNFDNISSIVWTPAAGLSCTDCLDPIASPSNTTNYTVTVTDTNGCEVMTTVQVRVQQLTIQVYIPNIISANGDNNNDRFTLFSDINVEEIEEMYIFDRWGELMYSAENFPPNDPSFGWDGKFKQEAVVQGVYVYLIKVRYIDQTREDFKGNLTVLE